MPLYNYGCQKCDHKESRNLSISSRKEPLETPCPQCGGKLYLHVGTVSVVGGVKDIHDVPESFKDVLRNIKKGSGKDCDIDV